MQIPLAPPSTAVRIVWGIVPFFVAEFKEKLSFRRELAAPIRHGVLRL